MRFCCRYLKQTGRLLSIVFVLVLTFGSVSDVLSDLWIAKWTTIDDGTEGEEGGSSSSPAAVHKHFLLVFVA